MIRVHRSVRTVTLAALLHGAAFLALAPLVACGGGGDDPDAATPTLLVAAAGQPDSQTVAPSTAVPVKPAVRVTDANGDPVQGVTVTFAPGLNSGTVTGGQQTTDASGIATVGSWTVGAATGRHTLVASTGSLTPVTFVANVGTSACDPVTYVLATSVNGTLTSGDCLLAADGSFLDLYVASPTAQVNHEIRMTSTAFDTFLLFISADNQVLALTDDESPSSTNARLHIMGPPASYVIGANAAGPGQGGAYTLTSTRVDQPAGCSFDTYALAGASFTESLASTDCDEQSGAGTAGKGDEYNIAVYPGRSVTVTQHSTAFDAFLRVYRADATGLTPVVSDNNGGGGTDARATFSVPAGGDPTLFVVVATTNAAAGTGVYTMQFTGAALSSLVAGSAPAKAPSLDEVKAQVAAWRTIMGARKARAQR